MIYTVDLDGNINVSVSAGSLTLNIDFQWAADIQGQLNKYLQLIDLEMRSDPLVDKDTGISIPSYDWLAYYEALRDVNITEWYETAQYVPRSVYKTAAPAITMSQKVLGALKVVDIVNGFKERCIWTARITDNISENSTIVSVRTGGWHLGPDQAWSVRFVSYKDSIGIDDLVAVTLDIEVNNE